MSEFMVLVELVGKIVSFLFNISLDIICVVFLVAACILPWRFLEIVTLIRKEDYNSRDDYRFFSCASLFLTVVDMIAIPIGLLGLLSPLRWYQIYWTFANYRLSDQHRHFDLRWGLIECSAGAVVDFACIFMGLVVSFSTFGRQCVVYQYALLCHTESALNSVSNSDLAHRYHKLVLKIDTFVLRTGVSVLIDYLCVLPFILTCMIPFNWYSFGVGLQTLFLQRPQVTTTMGLASVTRTAKQWKSDWEPFYDDVRVHFLFHAARSVIDLAAVPFYLLATISPLRSSLLRKDIAEIFATRAAQQASTDVAVFSYRYSWEVRKKVFSYGTLAIADLLLLPMLLPLFLTQYRYSAIKPTLTGEDARRVWGFQEFALIANQFALQVLDLLILLPSLPLLALTAVRWKPVGELLRKDKVFLEHSLELYTLAMQCLSLVVLDVLTLPFTLIVMLTYYRSKPLRQCWTSHVVWYEQPITFHCAAIANALIVLADMCVIFPCLLVLMVFGIHRIPIIGDEMLSEHKRSTADAKSSKFSLLVERKDDVVAEQQVFTALNLPETEPEAVTHEHNAPDSKDSVDLSALAPSSPEVHEVDSQREPAHGEGSTAEVRQSSSNVVSVSEITKEQTRRAEDIEIGPTNNIRGHIILHLLLCFFDIFWAVMALFVVLTVWRAYELMFKMQMIWKRAKAEHRGRVCFAYVLILNNYYDDLYSSIFEQFCYLWRDLLCLLPLSLVVATLYRLPSLISGLLGKLSSKPLGGNREPLFIIESCDVIQPQTGGPTVQMKLKRNPNAPAVTNLDSNAAVEMYVVGERLLNAMEVTFGAMIVNIVRALLPVKLKESSKTIGWVAFLEQYKSVSPAENEEIGRTYDLWIRLDLSKTTKKSSIIKKLKQLSRNTSIDLQLECYAYSTGSSGAQVRSKELLVRLSPSVDDMLNAIEDTELGHLPVARLNIRPELPHGSAGEDDRKSNFVNSFHLMVLLEVKEVFIDSYYLALFLCSMMSPYRFFKLIWMVLEPESVLPVRIMEDSLKIVNHLDNHIQEFKLAESPKLNVLIKAQLEYDLTRYYQVSNSRDDSTLLPNSLYRRPYYGYYYSYFNIIYDYYGTHDRYGPDAYNRSVREEIEFAHIKPYRSAITTLKKALDSVDRCELISSLVSARADLHNKMLQLYFTRVACSAQLLGCYNTFSEETNNNQANNYNIAMSLLTQEYDAVVVNLVKNKKELVEEIERRRSDARSSGKGLFSRCGLFKRPQSVTRWMIKRAFSQACTDLGFVVLTATLLVTLVRAVPLVRDLYRHNAWNITGYQGKLIVRRHLTQLYYDIWNIARLLLFQFILVVTVAGLPSYVVKAPSHLSSIRDAADCAQKHCTYILWYFCELLALVFAFKSYRIFFKASMYIILVPGACVAEAISFTGLDTTLKFAVGFAAWVALFAGSIRTVIVAYNAGAETDGGSSSDTAPWDSDRSLLALCGCLLFVLVLAVVSLVRNKDMLAPDRLASRSFEMTWSHLLSLFCGPLESLQLSAVVMFFYWSGRTGSDRPLILGTDNFSSPFMVWGSAYEGSSHGYYDSTSLASAAILVWSLMVSIPMALNNANSTPVRNWEKASQFKNSAAYQFIVNMISRLFSVWIMATLMRTVSCYSSSGSSTNAVLSTAAHVSCGGDHSRSLWSSRLSLTLFTYFIITSAVLHSDDHVFMQLNEQFGGGSVKDPQESLVKFSPLYVLLVKAVQLFVCAACFGGFYSASSVGPLIAIIFVSLAMGLVPLIIPFEACSLALVTPLRSAGFLCVTWTAIVCLARSYSRDNEGILRFESFVYVGWGVIFGLALLAMVLLEIRQRIQWEERIRVSGLNEAIEKLLKLVDTAFVDNALMRTNQNGVIVNSSMSSVIRAEVKSARSTTQLAKVLLFLEDLISAERLTVPFLTRRATWISELKSTSLLEEETLVTVTGHRERLSRYERATENIRRRSNEEVLIVDDIERVEDMVVRASINGGVNESDNSNVEAVTPQFRLILTHISQLSSGLRPSSCLAQFSREVFTILLSNHLPRDCCWEIYSYLINPKEVGRILHMTNEEITTPPEDYYYRYARSYNWPRLEEKPATKELYNENMLRYAMSFVANRREMIFQANTKQNQFA